MGAAAVPPAAGGEARTGLGLPIAIFASAQFVMVLDSSVMNVSISQIVADLDTTIQGVQLAITAYTLVMAAFMLAGAKLGDIMQPVRVALTGSTVSEPVNELLAVVGRERGLARLEDVARRNGGVTAA